MTLNSSIPARYALLALLSASTVYCIWKSKRTRQLKLSLQNPNPNLANSKGKIFFLSQTGTSKALANRLLDLLRLNGLEFDVINPKDYEPEDLPKETLVLIIASTWENGKPPSGAEFLANWVAESAEDFRVGSLILSGCKFAVFGVGSRSYGENFNAVGRDLSQRFRALGASEILPLCEGDVDEGDLDDVFDVWNRKLIGVLKGESLSEIGVVNGNECASESEYEDYSDEEEEEEESDIVDLEDIAGKGPSRSSKAATTVKVEANGEKEMVTPVIRASLQNRDIKLLVPTAVLKFVDGLSHNFEAVEVAISTHFMA